MYTPEEAPRLCARIELDIPANLANRLYGLSAGHVPRQQDVEVGQARLAEALVELQDIFGRCLGALDLLVCSVIAWCYLALDL
jgi:hypothetical protein